MSRPSCFIPLRIYIHVVAALQTGSSCISPRRLPSVRDVKIYNAYLRRRNHIIYKYTYTTPVSKKRDPYYVYFKY